MLLACTGHLAAEVMVSACRQKMTNLLGRPCQPANVRRLDHAAELMLLACRRQLINLLQRPYYQPGITKVNLAAEVMV
jgi:hypothetical protein